MGKYQYNKSFRKRSKKRLIRWVVLSIFIVLVIGGLIGLDIYKTRFKESTGSTRTITPETRSRIEFSVDQPTYRMTLPGDWKEIKSTNTIYDRSVIWQSNQKNAENRYVQIYVDVIPRLPVNKVLPLRSVGDKVDYEEMSENCAGFTQGGSFDAATANKSKPTPAKWMGLDFICDLPKVFDNVIGTTSKDGINTVIVTGANKGAHKYFFVYTDRNIRPDYSIFYNLLSTFQAK